MRHDNIAMLRDTIDILEQGWYDFDGKKVPLKLNKAEMKEADVYLPADIQKVSAFKDFKHVIKFGRCEYGCESTGLGCA